MENTNIAVISHDSLKSLSQNATDVVRDNQSSVEKAKKAMEALLAKLKGSEMNEQLDAEAKNLTEKIKKTIKILNERRKPVTQLFDQIKKMFTSMENEIGPDSPLYSEIQKYRDDFAAAKLAEQRRKELEVQRELAKKKEIADLREEIEIQIGNWFTDKLNATLNELDNIYKELTLINQKGIEKGIKNVPSEYPRTHFEAFKVKNITTQYLTINEKLLIKNEVLEGRYEKLAEQFKFEVVEYKLELSERIPVRINELEAIAEAEKKNAVEAKRLKAEAEIKAKAEADARMQAEAERQAKAKEEASRKKSEEEMLNLVVASEVLTETASIESKVKAALEIEVLNVAAFVQIFQFWFEREGKSLSVENFTKKTVKQMVAFAEKAANNNGDLIDSKLLKYIEVVSAK